MKHGNPPQYWEKIVSRTSKKALETFDACGCTGTYSCLPIDHNRIIFVACKKRYKNQIQWPYSKNCHATFGDFYNDKVAKMRCPLDCAVRGSAYDGGERYNKIKERTKHIKLYRMTIICEFIAVWKEFWNWFKELK